MSLGGPIADLFSIMVDVPRRMPDADIDSAKTQSSAELREQVMAAREFRAWRERREGDFGLTEDAAGYIERVAMGTCLSEKGIRRILDVGRTVADLEGHERVQREDVDEAASMRSRLADPRSVAQDAGIGAAIKARNARTMAERKDGTPAQGV